MKSCRGTRARRSPRIQDDTDRDYIMGAAQAKEYGIIDDVLNRRA
jgi:ATP-dependent protease ClpP protease subunit